jgi:addiction module RelE/StbE family toxin
MRAIVWSRRAERNLLSIRRYIEQFNPEAARSTAQRILESVRMASEHPQIGRAGHDGRYRQLPVPGTEYILFYLMRDRTLEIVAVLHGAQIIK